MFPGLFAYSRKQDVTLFIRWRKTCRHSAVIVDFIIVEPFPFVTCVCGTLFVSNQLQIFQVIIFVYCDLRRYSH